MDKLYLYNYVINSPSCMVFGVINCNYIQLYNNGWVESQYAVAFLSHMRSRCIHMEFKDVFVEICSVKGHNKMYFLKVIRCFQNLLAGWLY